MEWYWWVLIIILAIWLGPWGFVILLVTISDYVSDLPYAWKNREKNKKCAWCGYKGIEFTSGNEGTWYWEYRNKDGSEDRRVKYNYEIAEYTSKYECKKCNGVTVFRHYADRNPSKDVKVKAAVKEKRAALIDEEERRSWMSEYNAARKRAVLIEEEEWRKSPEGRRAALEAKRAELIEKLTDISGVSDKIARTILDQFPTLESITGASANDLSKVPGVGENIATAIKARLG